MNILICGTQMPHIYQEAYREKVFNYLDTFSTNKKALHGEDWKPESIIEGCCKESADEYAEEWAKKHDVQIQHHPSNPGNYLKRNIEMVNKASLVVAFWNQYSYGTAHTIAHATMKKIPVIVIKI